MADQKKTPPPMVLVVWEDAAVLDDDRWAYAEEHKYDPAIIHTVGYLLHRSKAGIIITGSWCPDHTGPRDQIPAGMIRKVTKLKG